MWFQPPTASWSTDTHTSSIGTHCFEIADLAVKSAPKHPQRSPTATKSFGTIKQASKHQEKTNASIVNNIS
ncbi:hypothetical protein GQ457_08G018140 [Hibiscus cannabinus]